MTDVPAFKADYTLLSMPHLLVALKEIMPAAKQIVMGSAILQRTLQAIGIMSKSIVLLKQIRRQVWLAQMPKSLSDSGKKHTASTALGT